jgi:hypothetical protein
MHNLGGGRITRFNPRNGKVLPEQLVGVRDPETALPLGATVTVTAIVVQKIAGRKGQIATPAVFLFTFQNGRRGRGGLLSLRSPGRKQSQYGQISQS